MTSLRLAVAAIALSASVARAQAPAPVERIAGIAAYVAIDYFEAVRDGQVVSPSEYAEQQQLTAEALGLARALAGDARAGLIDELTRMAAAIDAKAPLAEIAAHAVAVRSRLVADFGLEVAPRTVPSWSRARALYRSACAACHGDDGRAATAPARWLDPPPTPLTDERRMQLLSPQHVYRVLTAGAGESGMPAFPSLSAADRWSLACYAVALRHPRALSPRGARLFRAARARLAPTATRLATAADGELSALLSVAVPDTRARAAVLAWLRTDATFSPTTGGRFAAARRALVSAARGPASLAAAHAILPTLRTTAPDLARRFEAALAELAASPTDRAGVALRAQLILDAAEER